MFTKIHSATVVGIDGVAVTVEVDVTKRGLPNFSIVGLPNKSVEESKDRVRTAIRNSSFVLPIARITINLAPADIPKIGSGFDLPIAIGLLSGSGVINSPCLSLSLFVGELSLTGEIKSTQGILSLVELAKKNNMKQVFIPQDNVYEASLIKGIEIFGVRNLSDLVLHINNIKQLVPFQANRIFHNSKSLSLYDFAYVKGQNKAKRACEIAAAGFHNMMFKGFPGAGKTILSRSFQTILPDLSNNEVVEITKIYSSGGLLINNTCIFERPFRSPHHSISKIGLVGGGKNLQPGEITLAHRGVLFLDEVCEFSPSVLESLRQPMEDGNIWISRAKGKICYPSRFILIVASNPCRCGYYGHSMKNCQCSASSVMMYQKRISGPLMDRIDLHLNIDSVKQEELTSDINGEKSAEIKLRVISARKIQIERFKNTSIASNGEMNLREVKQHCPLTSESKDLLRKALARFSLSARSYYKIIKIARTIADLESDKNIENRHIAEALQYKCSNELM